MEDSDITPFREKESRRTVKKSYRLKILIFSSLFFLSFFTFYFYYCKKIVVIDGEEVSSYITFSGTVGEFLLEKGIGVEAYDALEPGKEKQLRRGDTVVIKRAQPVFLTIGAEMPKEVWTNAGTVGDFLGENNIVLDRFNLVFPVLAKPLQPFDEIKIMRMEEECFIEQEAIPFKTIRFNNPRLEPGSVQVLQEGREGLKENVLELIEQNGVLLYRSVVSSRIIVEPVNRILEYGENVVLSRGRRSYDFVRELEMIATAYCPGTPESGCPIDEHGAAYCTGFFNDGYTSTGKKAIAGDGSQENPHIIAVDPAVIPLQSLVFIKGYGFARAEDTGSAIKNNCIDLLFDNHQEALSFGRKNVEVYLIDE